jgi:hypothetical protein
LGPVTTPMTFAGCALFRHPQVFRHVSRVSNCWLVTTSHYGPTAQARPPLIVAVGRQFRHHGQRSLLLPCCGPEPTSSTKPPFPVPQKRGLVGIYKNKTNLNIPRGFYISCFSPGWAGTAGARAYIIYLSVTRAGRQLAGSDRGKMIYIHMMMMLEPWYFVCTYRTKASVHRYKVRRTLIQRRNG